MVITIDNVINKIKQGKLDLPHIHKGNADKIQSINTRNGVYYGVNIGNDDYSTFYAAFRVVDGGNKCNVVIISVDDNGFVQFYNNIVGTVNKRYEYKQIHKLGVKAYE